MAMHRGTRTWAMALAGAAGLVALAGCNGSNAASAAQVTDNGVYGISVETDVRLSGDRVLLGGTMSMSGATAAVSFYRNDLPDRDVPPPKEMPLPAGRAVMVSASMWPSCAVSAPAPAPVLVLRSRRSGREVTDRLTLAVSGDASDVIRRWCAAGVRVVVSQLDSSVHETARVQFVVSNPGPGPVTVTSARWSAPGVTWLPASVTVPGGQAARMIVHVRVRCGYSKADGPWAHGLLTVRRGSGAPRPVTLAEPVGLMAIECQYVRSAPTDDADGTDRPDGSDGS